MSERVTVAVGDIHGCLEEFDDLLKKIQYNKNQMRLVLLGDLLDRGPDPVGVVRRVRELDVECIMGNHEEKHIRYRKHQKAMLETGKPNPMKHMAHDAVIANEKLNDQDWTMLKNLPLKLDLGNNWFAVHGGCEPRYSLADQSPRQIIRVRYVDERGIAVALNPDKSQPENTVYWTEQWKGPESIIYGHCVHSLTDVKMDYYFDGENHVKCLGIDTGCCFGGKLTAAFFRPDPEYGMTFDYVQVKAKKKYYEGYGDE